jgi:phospholipid transport system substrate-binding protein
MSGKKGSSDMKRRGFSWVLVMGLALASVVHAQTETPDAMIKRLSTEVLDQIKGDPALRTGEVHKIVALVDSKIMPNVNFTRMTASAVGHHWRGASAEQKKRLQEEFKSLLVRTYAGALTQVKDHVVVVKPLRSAPAETEVIVRSEVRGRGDPIQLDYRVEKTDDGAGWKIYDLNVLGSWLVENYKTQFAQEINKKGIDGLIEALAQRNKANNARK